MRTGRRREFAAYGWDASEIPDPQDPETWRSSVLDWTEVDKAPHRELLRWYRDLLALRARSEDLRDDRLDSVQVVATESWLVVTRGALRVVANLDSEVAEIPLDGVPAYEVMTFGSVELVAESVRLSAHGVAVFAV